MKVIDKLEFLDITIYLDDEWDRIEYIVEDNKTGYHVHVMPWIYEEAEVQKRNPRTKEQIEEKVKLEIAEAIATVQRCKNNPELNGFLKEN